MNIAVFSDMHGRALLAFMLCARWQQETGERISLILQAGDLGAYPDLAQLDRATIRHAQRDENEVGFQRDFVEKREEVAKRLAETTCPMIFVRGNHEDHTWLDDLERRAAAPIFPVDVYERIFCLQTGVPYTFAEDGSELTILGVGRIGAPVGTGSPPAARYAQPSELERLSTLGANLLFETVVNLPPPGPSGPLSDGSLQAVNPVTGAVLWRSTGHAYRDMALVGKTLYVNAEDALHAFDTQIGNPIWSQSFNASTSFSVSMTQLGSTLFLVNGATLSALDGLTHTILWQTPFNGLDGQVTDGVYCAVSAQGLNGGASQDLYGFDVKTGAQLWQRPASSATRQVVGDGAMCYTVGAVPQTISSALGTLNTPLNRPIQGLNAQSGSISWTVNIDSKLRSTRGRWRKSLFP